jgi:hypothetical protein
VDPTRPATIEIRVVRAERGDLERDVVGDDENDAELGSDRDGTREERTHRFGRRARRDVEVDGIAAEEVVADAPAREVGLVARLPKPPHDGDGQRALVARHEGAASHAGGRSGKRHRR